MDPVKRPPKRSAEQMVQQYMENLEDRHSKKTRFDQRNPSTLAPDVTDEDIILELDEIGKTSNQTKRNAVRLEGYESDSSQENFDARAKQRAKAAKSGKQGADASKGAEENDMFADLEEEHADGDEDEVLMQEGKKRKEVRFMDENEIEGQVASSKSGGHVSADFTLGRGRSSKDADHESSSESGDDEERDRLDEELDVELGAGSKKKHAPKLDAFHMKNETEEGKFDESGNFVRKAADPFAVHDAWLQGSTSKADMKKAWQAERKREEDRQRRELEDDSIPTGELVSKLISHLDAGETVLEALARLGSAKRRKRPKKQTWQRNRRKNEVVSEMDVETEDDPPDLAETSRKEAVEAITGAADQLLARGQMEIYHQARELLMRQYKRETGGDWAGKGDSAAGDDGAPNTGHFEYEYRWPHSGESHGPYDGMAMTAWKAAGYFNEGVEFRTIGSMTWSQDLDFI